MELPGKLLQAPTASASRDVAPSSAQSVRLRTDAVITGYDGLSWGEGRGHSPVDSHQLMGLDGKRSCHLTEWWLRGAVSARSTAGRKPT